MLQSFIVMDLSFAIGYFSPKYKILHHLVSSNLRGRDEKNVNYFSGEFHRLRTSADVQGH